MSTRSNLVFSIIYHRVKVDEHFFENILDCSKCSYESRGQSRGKEILLKIKIALIKKVI